MDVPFFGERGSQARFSMSQRQVEVAKTRQMGNAEKTFWERAVICSKS